MSNGTALLDTTTRALRHADGSSLPFSPYASGPPTTTNLGISSGPPLRATNEQTTRRILNYELADQIGEGGMGVVYRARHLWLGRTVAIKFISAQILNNPEAINRFRHEALAVGALDHPNIVRASDAGQTDGHYFLVTEFVAGQDLSTVVQRHGRLEIADACEAIRQAAIGLQHAHERGLVHRDVKPSNLLLDQTGTVKLLDFGLARMMVGQTTLTSTGQVLGTLDFLAPEQAQDARKVDPRSDLYSLGCTLYYLLAATAPFSGPAYDTAASKIKGHLVDRPKPVAELRRRIPLALVACLDRMMAKSAGDRFETAAEAAEALEPFCRDANLAGLVGASTSQSPVRNLADKRRSTGAGFGETAERMAAVFGWALRGAFASRPATEGNAPRRQPFFSLSGLALFAFLGFILSHFSCVPMGGEPITPLEEIESDGSVQFFQFGFGSPTPVPTVIPSAMPKVNTPIRSAPANSSTTTAKTTASTASRPATSAPPAYQPPPPRGAPPPPPGAGGHPPPRR